MKSQPSRQKVTRQSERKSVANWYLLAIATLILAIAGGLVSGPLLMQRNQTEVAPQKAASSARGAQTAAWHVGMLRLDGLRIAPSGRTDASHVLNPNQFADKEVRHAYWVATQIPAVLNKLYCWCGCENRGIHRSNLQCFEDQMAVTCEVCRGTAEIAWQMTQAGVQDAGEIQAAVDARWGPKG
ncbi:hypothetical protein HDG40_006501 [Paraburkholderia sp. JPY158]|uniref:Uncharacterized protein n=1 Tax=Paraburkholderia atlantica TaxID=2654982 RepID=A0A7W8QDN2_PARAM|nr:PCYCGC motif-containing (lipo)protein [Paraburkholderia atlantica]MBB5428314.1 hypothetical protein [Paraburkholderia atlantica]